MANLPMDQGLTKKNAADPLPGSSGTAANRHFHIEKLVKSFPISPHTRSAAISPLLRSDKASGIDQRSAVLD
jgi:hypothetical protein